MGLEADFRETFDRAYRTAYKDVLGDGKEANAAQVAEAGQVHAGMLLRLQQDAILHLARRMDELEQ